MFLSGMLAWGRTRVKTNSLSPLVRGAHWLPAAAWMGGIFYLSQQSAPLDATGLSQQSAPLGATASAAWSTVAHLGLYMGLALLLFWALARNAGPRTPGWVLAAVAFALTVLYGVSDELHQTFVPGRTASEADLGLDAAGATMGVTLALLWDKFLTARHLRR